MAPVLPCECDPVLHGLRRSALDSCVDRQLQRGEGVKVAEPLERAGDPPHRVDPHVRARETRVEQCVIDRFDTGLPDDHPWAGVLVARQPELGLAYLAEQAEVFATQLALRVAPRRLPGRLEARIVGAALVEVV